MRLIRIAAVFVLLCFCFTCVFAKGADSSVRKNSPSVKNNEGKINSLMREGSEFFQTGNFEEAVKTFDEVIKLDRDNVHARYNKAAALTGLQKYKEALKEYDKLIKRNKKELDAYRDRINVLLHMKKYKQALKSLDDFEKLSPKEQISIRLTKIQIYHNTDKNESALSEINDLIKEYTDNAGLHIVKGDLLAVMKEYREALAEFSYVLENSASFPDVFYRIAELYIYLEEYDNALTNMNRYVFNALEPYINESSYEELMSLLNTPNTKEHEAVKELEFIIENKLEKRKTE